VNIGTFAMPLHPASRPLVDVLKENAEKIILADQLGFAEAWIGEHFSAATEPICSPLMFLASLLPRTKQIKLATGVICLPNRHPAVVAGEVALFDHLSEGRFIFGIGPGGLASDMELFSNLDGDVRNGRMAESISTILKIWSQDPPYDLPGKHWQVKITDNVIPELGVGYMGKPYTKPHPPIALSSMSPDSGSVAYAAKQGWRPVSANFAPESTVLGHWKKYVEGLRGRRPRADWQGLDSRPQYPDWRKRFAGRGLATRSQGLEFLHFDYLWEVLKRANYTIVAKPDLNMKDEDVTVESIVKATVIYGSPKTVAEKIVSLRERSGPFGTLLLAALDGSGENLERERLTMRRLKDVVPLVNAA